MNDPLRLFDEIRRTYRRYLESPFRLRYNALMSERREMLDRDGQLWREPLFEPIAPYSTSGFTIAQACEQLGVHPEAANFITRGLFPANRPLYGHQFHAWEHSRQGQAVVVTSGTGSGKTECYLIPIFAYLVEEALGHLGEDSPRWEAPGAEPQRWWRQQGQGWISQRREEAPERPAAVRALLLYPLNALIEDQLNRIRRTCDTPNGRQWLEERANGNRFWFGRYNGLTPVPGLRTNNTKRQQLKERLLDMDQEWQQALASVAAHSDTNGDASDILYYFQNPDGSEMWSRWDMQDAPPDILITNYSMLNIMLMRGLESNIFEQTKQWLEQDRRHHIFLY